MTSSSWKIHRSQFVLKHSPVNSLHVRNKLKRIIHNSATQKRKIVKYKICVHFDALWAFTERLVQTSTSLWGLACNLFDVRHNSLLHKTMQTTLAFDKAISNFFYFKGTKPRTLQVHGLTKQLCQCGLRNIAYSPTVQREGKAPAPLQWNAGRFGWSASRLLSHPDKEETRNMETSFRNW